MIKDLLSRAEKLSDCRVLPPLGLPLLPAGYQLPEDLCQFYMLCGGVDLFSMSHYPITVVSPSYFVSANIEITGELGAGDRSADWWIVSKSDESQLISIDLNSARLGHCYDSFWDRHAIVGSCAIVARSFSEFLERSLAAQGKELYWLSETFVSLGDAYD